MIRCMLLLTLSLFALSAAMAQHDAAPGDSGAARSSAIVFSSGFEEGNKGIWDDYDSNPDSTNLLMPDPGPFGRAGNHVMRLRVPPGRGGADLVKVLPGSYDRLYLRWYQQWEPGYDFTARNHGSGLHAGIRNLLGRSNYRPSGGDMFTSWLEPAGDRLNLYTYYRGMYMDCVNPNGACWGDHFPCWFDEGEHICMKAEHRERVLPPVMETGRWYCLELMIDAGTPVQADSLADGEADFWIDGVEYGPFRHLWFRTTPDLKLSILWLDLFHHEAHSVEGILLDDVIVATERIGCGALAAPPPPEAPRSAMPACTVFPQPGAGISTLRFETPLPRGARLAVIDLLGRRVFERDLDAEAGRCEAVLDLRAAAPGTYLLRLEAAGAARCVPVIRP